MSTPVANNTFPNSNIPTTKCTDEALVNLREAVKASPMGLTIVEGNREIIQMYPTSPTPAMVIHIRQYRNYYHVTASWPHEKSTNYQETCVLLLGTSKSVVDLFGAQRHWFQGGNQLSTTKDMMDGVLAQNFIPNAIITLDDKTGIAYIHVKYSALNAELMVVNGYYTICYRGVTHSLNQIDSLSVTNQTNLVLSDIRIKFHDTK